MYQRDAKEQKGITDNTLQSSTIIHFQCFDFMFLASYLDYKAKKVFGRKCPFYLPVNCHLGKSIDFRIIFCLKIDGKIR